ncbi:MULTISPECIES: hypothetical protein [unclassified Nocardioides]|uniref:hypothetical protein n=1 Tax=unclassified Nocardioides TaxID=2615069 RepID=UPI000702140D|nr:MULTISPECIES: hypothetical protein [unclassified Nocardioides]KQY56292.1 hypothetical protein ASD30_08020 [Nocardioides sp. Root140]KQZ75076.1 hypothetical protein ASD66_01485 [Nocardioides sp. Root151]KRF14151.1 hypothetical protein ASH02_07260 [Nocardioides sp. Soil796]
MIPETIKAQDVMQELGFVATRAQLLEHLTRREITGALRQGHIVRLGRGRFGLRSAHQAAQAAMRLSGTASHLSAAQLHGWPIARAPARPWVTVPRSRNVPASVREEMHVVFAPAVGRVTDPLRTVLDCARKLPFDEALSVADSALRARDVDKAVLVEAAAQARGPGSVQIRRVAESASGLSANSFESCLRAIALDVGLDVIAQHPIQLPGRLVHPDLVDVGRRLVLEADSYRHHRLDIRVFQQDLWRYTSLTVADWTVLRFGHAHVMSERDWVRACLRTYL